MKILIVTPSYFPVRGGGEQVIYELASRYAKTHEVHIVTPQLPNAPKEETDGNLRIFRFPMIRQTLLDAVSGQMVLSRLLPKLHAEHGYDFVQMFFFYQLGGAVVRFCRKNRLPLLTTLAGWDTYDPVRPVPALFNPYLAWVMNHSSDCVTCCRHMARSAVKQGCSTPPKVIPHGTSMLTAKSGRVEIRQKYGIAAEKKIILSVQRLAPRKGLDLLVDAAASIGRDDVVFLVCGKGPDLEKLQLRAKERGVEQKVVFAGFVPDDELKDHYEQSDLFALPSLYEGFGVVYVDALNCGLPVVTTTCGGPEDIVDETNGFLVPVGDLTAFTNALSLALERKWDRAQIRADARKYDWDSIVEQYEAYFTAGS